MVACGLECRPTLLRVAGAVLGAVLGLVMVGEPVRQRCPRDSKGAQEQLENRNESSHSGSPHHRECTWVAPRPQEGALRCATAGHGGAAAR
jgi:hypothetical protein